MLNRGKDSWNKGMIISTNTKSSKKTASRETPSQSMRHERSTTSKQMSQRQSTPDVPQEKASANQMRSCETKSQRVRQVKSTTPSKSEHRREATPLQQFDVASFFEENLFDIIDLEENRSGVKEFEEAVKEDE